MERNLSRKDLMLNFCHFFFSSLQARQRTRRSPGDAHMITGEPRRTHTTRTRTSTYTPDDNTYLSAFDLCSLLVTTNCFTPTLNTLPRTLSLAFPPFPSPHLPFLPFPPCPVPSTPSSPPGP